MSRHAVLTRDGSRRPETALPIRPLDVLGALALALVPVVFLLFAESLRAPVVAFRFDTPTYVWQAKELGALGLVDPRITRPGFPLLVALFHGALGLPEYQLSPLLAFTLAGLIGLAAAGAARAALGPGALRAASVGLAVGTSFQVVRMAGGYYGNVLNALFLVGALAPLAGALASRPWLPAAFLLLFAAGLAHWMFLAIFTVILMGAAGWLLVRRLMHRSAPPSSRVILTVGVSIGATILVVAVLFPLLGGRFDLFGVTRATEMFLGRFRRWYRQSGPLLVLPLTLVGAAILAWETEERRGGFLRIVSASWLAATVIAMIGWRLWPAIPFHRFWLFAMPLPFLAGLGAEGAGRLASLRMARSSQSARRAVRLLITATLLAAVSVPGFRLVNVVLRLPVTEEQLQAATNLGAYLSWLPEGHPVVIVLDMPGASSGVIRHRENVIRSALPGRRQADTFFYWGRAELLLQGRATPQSSPKVRREAADRWERVRDLPDRSSVAILERFDQGAFAAAVEGGAPRVAPGVAIARGPVPDRLIRPPDFDEGPLPPVIAAGLAAGIILLLGIVGIAWAAALLPGAHPFVIIALAPAFGGAVALPMAIILQGIGVSLAGPGGVAALALALLTGGGLRVSLRRASGGRPSRSVDEP